jgi:hypothetical protein
VLVLSPTRELTQQIAQVTARLSAVVGVGTVCIHGGVPKLEQARPQTLSRHKTSTHLGTSQDAFCSLALPLTDIAMSTCFIVWCGCSV